MRFFRIVVITMLPIRDLQMDKRKHPSVGDIVYWDYDEKNRQYYVVLEMTDHKANVVYLGGDVYFAHHANKPVSWSLFGLDTSWWLLE